MMTVMMVVVVMVRIGMKKQVMKLCNIQYM
jgi:hypothetical protein